jgi:hypothetical protein
LVADTMEPSLKLPIILPAAPDAGCVRGHKKPLCGYRIDQFDIFPIMRTPADNVVKYFQIRREFSTMNHA